jgi:MOSC domain-containing protein YiiM
MSIGRTGRIAGIARRDASRAPMETLNAVDVFADGGLDGDYKGRKFRLRGVTVLAREAWEAALAELRGPDGKPVDLPWTTRRANVLVEGVDLPKARGGIVRMGPVLLEVTYPTQPCSRMEEAYQGLLKALHPDWRGGITCRVLEGGRIMVGDEVTVLVSPPQHKMRLPG